MPAVTRTKPRRIGSREHPNCEGNRLRQVRLVRAAGRHDDRGVAQPYPDWLDQEEPAALLPEVFVCETGKAVSIFGWSLPPGCGRLPGEEDDGERTCPKCNAAVFPEPFAPFDTVTAFDEDGTEYVDHYLTEYVCQCGHKWKTQ